MQNRCTAHRWASHTLYVDVCERCGCQESVFAPNHYQSPNSARWDIGQEDGI